MAWLRIHMHAYIKMIFIWWLANNLFCWESNMPVFSLYSINSCICLGGKCFVLFPHFPMFGRLENMGQQKTNLLVNRKHSYFCSSCFPQFFWGKQATEKTPPTPIVSTPSRLQCLCGSLFLGKVCIFILGICNGYCAFLVFEL